MAKARTKRRSRGVPVPGPSVSASWAPCGPRPGPFPHTVLPGACELPEAPCGSIGWAWRHHGPPGGGRVEPRNEGGGSVACSETPRRRRAARRDFTQETRASLCGCGFIFPPVSFQPDSLFPGGGLALAPVFGKNHFVSRCRHHDRPGWPVTGERSSLRPRCHCHLVGDSPAIFGATPHLGTKLFFLGFCILPPVRGAGPRGALSWLRTWEPDVSRHVTPSARRRPVTSGPGQSQHLFQFLWKKGFFCC